MLMKTEKKDEKLKGNLRDVSSFEVTRMALKNQTFAKI